MNALTASAPAATAAHTSDDVLVATDPRIAKLIAGERDRQRAKLIFIASESTCPEAVRKTLSSELSHLYAEGYPSSRMAVWERDRLGWDGRHHSFYRRYGDRRYYKGCEYVNLIEAEAMARLARLFAPDGVSPDDIYANVQSLSGAAANNAIYEALVPPQGTVFGMSLSCGGHLTHGAPVNRSGRNYRIVPYSVDAKGQFDFDAMREAARREKPDLVIAGFSAFPYQIDWQEFRSVADAAGAYLLADIAHPAGLVAGREFPNPVGIADVVSFTTHKTLCGPRGAAILTTDPEIARKVDFAVFPGEQGGPHIQAIAGKAVAFQLADSDEFRALQRRVKENAAALAESFAESGLTVGYGGTNTHLCLVDLRPLKTSTGHRIGADIAARVLDNLGLTCNKNSLLGDTRAGHPSGLRFGTTWVSQRGLGPDDLAEIGRLVADTLTSMKPFSVWTAVGDVGRVRMPSSVLRSVRSRIHALLEKRGEAPSLGAFCYPQFEPLGASAVPRDVASSDGASETRPFGEATVAARHRAADAERASLEGGTACVDLRHAPAILVRGERAGIALTLAGTAEVTRQAVGSVQATTFLRGDGSVVARATLARLDDEPGDIEAFLLLADSDEGIELVEWLRELSDGFVEFDDDITRKIDGPLVIEDLGVGDAPSARLTWVGDAGVTAATGLRPIAATVRALDDGGWCVARPDGRATECVVPRARADAWWNDVPADQRVGEASWTAWSRTDDDPGLDPDVVRRKPWCIGQHVVVTDEGDATSSWAPPGEHEGELLRTPLHAWHKAHTKKYNLVPFAGWDMPVLYKGIAEEHKAVREAAGLFDVSHMGTLEVRGKGAARFLDLVTTNYVTRLRNGEGQYSYTLDPHGEVLDDLLVYRLSSERCLVVVNASNAAKVWSWWNAVARRECVIDPARPSVQVDVDVELIDLRDPSAGDDRKIDIAFQGPASEPTLLALCDDARSRLAISRLKRFEVVEAAIAGDRLLVAKTGYTGEEVGYELYVHPDRVVALWERILEEGASRGVVPAGLGARDSTRTEAGFPLYGHELAGDHSISPFGAGYSSFVKWHKPWFVGRTPLQASEASRSCRIQRAVVRAGARPVRVGDTVVDAKGRYLGRVTSSAFAGAEQIVLFYGKRHMVKRGAPLAIFPLPRSGKPLTDEPRKDQLDFGDKVLLPIAAEVVPRFMTRTEKTRRVYER